MELFIFWINRVTQEIDEIVRKEDNVSSLYLSEEDELCWSSATFLEDALRETMQSTYLEHFLLLQL